MYLYARIVAWSFFFTPNDDISTGYFNLEANCVGSILMFHQLSRRVEDSPLAESHLKQIDIAHSVKGSVENEITFPITWTLEYRLPFEILEQYSKLSMPAAGVIWRANFYKCADHNFSSSLAYLVLCR